MGSVVASSNERPRTDWTASMDQFFIELLLDQLGRGNTVDNAFNKKAWTDMLAMFNAKFGSQYGKRILKNRFKKLLKCYCDITNLLKQGFSWNEQQQMVSADDDVWDAYIKVYISDQEDWVCERGEGACGGVYICSYTCFLVLTDLKFL